MALFTSAADYVKSAERTTPSAADYSIIMTRKSFTLVLVGPVIIRSPTFGQAITPVPDRMTDHGFSLLSSLAIDIFAVLRPTEVGENLTVTVVLLPGNTGDVGWVMMVN